MRGRILSVATILAIQPGLASCYGPESPSEKAAWAVLQSMEFSDRGNSQAGPIVRTSRSGFVVLGVPGVGEPNGGLAEPPLSARSWLILNEHLPNGRVWQLNSYPAYDLSCDYVGRLRAEVPDVDDHVIQHLRTICH